MANARLHIRFATIGHDDVAVLEWGRAFVQQALAFCANFGRIREIADDATVAAMGNGRLGIDFATVGIHSVAVPEPRRATAHFARAILARGRRIRWIASIVAAAAMVGARIRIRLAAVIRCGIAYCRSRRASDRLALDGHHDVRSLFAADRCGYHYVHGREHFGVSIRRVRDLEIQRTARGPRRRQRHGYANPLTRVIRRIFHVPNDFDGIVGILYACRLEYRIRIALVVDAEHPHALRPRSHDVERQIRRARTTVRRTAIVQYAQCEIHVPAAATAAAAPTTAAAATAPCPCSSSLATSAAPCIGSTIAIAARGRSRVDGSAFGTPRNHR